VDLEQRCRTVGGTARGLRHRAHEAEGAQIKRIDARSDEANRIVGGDEVVQATGEARDLPTILACDEALYPDFRGSGESDTITESPHRMGRAPPRARSERLARDALS
jgi:hypothetical protein